MCGISIKAICFGICLTRKFSIAASSYSSHPVHILEVIDTRTTDHKKVDFLYYPTTEINVNVNFRPLTQYSAREGVCDKFVFSY